MSHPIVLMYHGIIKSENDIPPEREVGAELYDVKYSEFCQQMEMIKGKEVLVTFDDGEENNFRHAFPVLKQLGIRAYFLVAVNLVGTKGYMDWEQLCELRDADMVVGSHGLNHRILTGLKKNEIEKELMESKDVLEHHLTINVKALSIPRGFWNKEIMAVAEEAGYEKVFVSGSYPDSKGGIARIPVRPTWDKKRFEMALKGEVPFNEKVTGGCKSLTKQILGSQGYDKLRGWLIRAGRKT